MQGRVRSNMEEPLEVCGDTYPRYMTLYYRTRLIDANDQKTTVTPWFFVLKFLTYSAHEKNLFCWINSRRS